MEEKYTNYLKKLFKVGFEMIYENKKPKKKIIKKINPYEDINTNQKFILEEDEEEILAKIQVGKLLKDDPNLIFGVSKEKMNEIIELKNIIQQKLNEIGEYLQEADANLEKIEENIEIAVDEMIKGNKYLEQASNYAIERRATKFRNILIGVVGGICVALPGVNLIGGGIVLAGGLAINKFIEKLEKKYIKKIQNL
jgi:t-SNARE complex subunit (syntaxin)